MKTLSTCVQNIRKNLLYLMWEQKLGAYDLAEKSDVAASLIFKIRSGNSKNPRQSTVVKLARALGVTLEKMVSPPTPEEEIKIKELLPYQDIGSYQESSNNSGGNSVNTGQNSQVTINQNMGNPAPKEAPKEKPAFNEEEYTKIKVVSIQSLKGMTTTRLLTDLLEDKLTVLETISLPTQFFRLKGPQIAVRLDGSSAMDPLVPPNSVVLARPCEQSEIESGSIVIARTGDNAIVRKIVLGEGQEAWLEASNPAFPGARVVEASSVICLITAVVKIF